MSKLIIGIDEVGRGCWAGPMVVGAVMLDSTIEGLNDSKKLSKTARMLLSEEIKATALFAGLGWVWPDEIDKLGLTKATTLGIERSLKDVIQYSQIIIDGNINYLPDNLLVKTMVAADSVVPAVSVASILAKVARDTYMYEQSLTYPMYGFDKHVGYGTKFHKEALLDHGVCDMHRKSYKPIKQLMLG